LGGEQFSLSCRTRRVAVAVELVASWLSLAAALAVEMVSVVSDFSDFLDALLLITAYGSMLEERKAYGLDDLPFGEEGGDFCTCLMLSRENEVCI
jgi:hypothetical protein